MNRTGAYLSQPSALPRSGALAVVLGAGVPGEYDVRNPATSFILELPCWATADDKTEKHSCTEVAFCF